MQTRGRIMGISRTHIHIPLLQPPYPSKEENKCTSASNFMQYTLKSFVFNWMKCFQVLRVQHIALNFLQTERSLRRYSFHLAFQSNHRLVYGVLTRAACGINNSKTLLEKKSLIFFLEIQYKNPHTPRTQKVKHKSHVKASSNNFGSSFLPYH